LEAFSWQTPGISLAVRGSVPGSLVRGACLGRTNNRWWPGFHKSVSRIGVAAHIRVSYPSERCNYGSLALANASHGPYSRAGLHQRRKSKPPRCSEAVEQHIPLTGFFDTSDTTSQTPMLLVLSSRSRHKPGVPEHNKSPLSPTTPYRSLPDQEEVRDPHHRSHRSAIGPLGAGATGRHRTVMTPRGVHDGE
jgi:hypothetical protein